MILLLLVLFVPLVCPQTCPVDIPDAERRDCHPWANATQEACEERGCVWCEPVDISYPWCFINDKVCPSLIPEGDRVDCQPGGGTRDDCLQQDCVWCETSTPAIPWCFDDPSTSLGGDLCPVNIPEAERIGCLPEGGSRESCLQRGCYYCNDTTGGAPECFAPLETGYRMQGSPVQTPLGWRVTLDRVDTPSWYGQDIAQVTLDVEFHTDTRLQLKFYDASDSRFEVPLVIPAPGGAPGNPLYDITFNSNPVFSFAVTRKSTGAVIFDSSIGGFQFADQFIQIATRLDSAKIYGFGEQEHPRYLHDMNWVTWAMWARDQQVKESNGYGVQPVYMNIEQSNNAHGVLFLNANAQEVVLQPAPGLTYRTTGGILDMYMFLGPTPDEVVQQFTTAVGYPLMPPYWALGFHLCRYGYTDLDHMKEAVDRMRQYDIPHDVQYGDIDYMDGQKDFTIDPVNFAGLEEYVDHLKTEGTRFIIILDPAIYMEDPPGVYPPLDTGYQYGVWIVDSDGVTPTVGRVWPGRTHFPDFLKDVTETWWTNHTVEFHNRLDFTGLWIDMNEPSNFVSGDFGRCNDNRWNEPPYVPQVRGGAISVWRRTTCMDTITDLGISYNAHSLYGFGMSKQSLTAARAIVPGERSIVFSRSTFPGSGQWGQHWLGDNKSQWSHLRNSIIGMFEFNQFGIPYVGADICGFGQDTEEQLCRRWQQLGSFYPFARNHNAIGFIDQDPGVWPTVANDTRNALLIRYRLLPYLYTLFHKSHTTGSTVVRPLFFEFPSETPTHAVDNQFLWGSDFLVSACIEENATSVVAYLPDSRWYDYYTGQEESSRMEFAVLDTPLGDINLHFRGGSVVPIQQPANSTMWSRSNPMGLMISLDDTNKANGDLFWDDGVSVDTFQNREYLEVSYNVSGSVLTNTILHDGYPDVGLLVMDDIVIHGENTLITSVLIDGQIHTDWSQDPDSMRITIGSCNLLLNTAFSVSWS